MHRGAGVGRRGGDSVGGLPLWLLDVDGVLNAVADQPDRSVWRDWVRGSASADGTPWPILFSPSVVAGVRRIHDEGLAEIRWLTTWQEHANGELRELLGLPVFTVAADDDDDGDDERARGDGEPVVDTGADSHGEAVARPGVALSGWWKLRVVRRIVSGEARPLIWTDDDLGRDRDARDWVRTNVASSLLIAPPPRVGLTSGHLKQIDRFCRHHAGPREP